MSDDGDGVAILLGLGILGLLAAGWTEANPELVSALMRWVRDLAPN